MLSALSQGCILTWTKTDDKNMKDWHLSGFVFLFQFQITACKKRDLLNLNILLLYLNVDSGSILVVALSTTSHKTQNKTVEM